MADVTEPATEPPTEDEVDFEPLAADAGEAAVDETAPDPDHDPYRPAVPLWADDGTTYVLDWTHPQLAADFDVLDLFAAGGGWDHGARSVEGIDHDKILGLEWDLAACRTAVAAGHRRLMADIALLDPRDFAARAIYLGCIIRGLIGSPPCQGFSMAGDGGGRRDTPFILEAVDRILATDLTYDAVQDVLDWLRSVAEDPKSALVLEPLRWALVLGPEWLAWEQVPAVLPLWKAIARVLKKAGFKVWVGKLVAADYGVPQTRTRAILIASRVRHVSMPEPTHAKGGADATLFSDPLPPWVSMASALGWGMTARPSTTLVTGANGGGPDPMSGGSGSRAVHARERAEGRFVEKGELVGFPRRADSDPNGTEETVLIDGIEYRARDLTHTDQPAQTVTEKVRSWQRWPAEAVELRGGVMPNAARRTLDKPAQTIAFGNNAAQWIWEVRDGVPVPPEGVDPIMLSGGIAGDGVPRHSDQPAPTLGGKGTAVWVESEEQWIRDQRLATGETPKGAAQLATGAKPDREWRPLEPGEATTELRRGGDRITEGFDPAAEPAATVTSRVDRWQTHLSSSDELAASTSYCIFCRCSDDLHDADGFCAGPCGGILERCTWKEAPMHADRLPDGHPYWTQPAPTIVSTRRSLDGMIVGRQLPPGESVAVGGWDDRTFDCMFHDEGIPDAPCNCPDDGARAGTHDIVTGKVVDRTPGDQIGPNRPDASDPDQATLGVWGDRPATTVVATRNPDIVSGPGYRGAGAAPRQEAPGGVRVTVQEAAILQSFPAWYPWQGTKSKQYEQVGNACPPRLSAHILSEATGSPPPVYEER